VLANGGNVLPNAFIGKTEKPSDRDLEVALGTAKALWDQLVTELRAEHGVDTQEWKSYSPKAGWSLRLLRKKRCILYLGAHKGSFGVAFILGDKAIKALREDKFPARILKIVDEASRYPEGTGIRFEVKAPKDV
jgi:hypothetical protein